MEYRKLGRTDIEVPTVVFGAWAIGGWMWGPQDHPAAVAAIQTSLDLGVNAIDTAPVYGFGRSEEIVAEAIQGRKRRELVLLTKFGLRWDHDGGGVERWQTKDCEGRPMTVCKYARPDSVILECERSLQRLKTDYIDVYQMHWPDETTPIEETFGAVARLIEQGKVRAAGVSNCPPELAARAHAVTPLACTLPPFCMVLRDAEADVIPWCRKQNVGVVVYSPLQRGLLTGKFRSDQMFSEGDHRAKNPFFRSENIEAVNSFLEKIRPIAQSRKATVAQLVIAWTIRWPGVTAALVGARNPAQAAENAKAANFDFTEDEMRRVDELLEDVKIER
jgi:aryl-alcohol dehydrogenase-like predicted oxidoreductase